MINIVRRIVILANRTYDIVYNIVYDIVRQTYDIVYDLLKTYDIKRCFSGSSQLYLQHRRRYHTFLYYVPHGMSLQGRYYTILYGLGFI